VQRQRTNAQLTLQYKPVKELVTTLDYTYSENKIQTKRNDLSAWFNFGPSSSAWTGGSPSSPLNYKEFVATATSPWARPTSPPRRKTNRWASTPCGNRRGPALQLDTHHSTANRAPTARSVPATPWHRQLQPRQHHGRLQHDFPVLSIEGADFVKAPAGDRFGIHQPT
jgi:hypothetical protein